MACRLANVDLPTVASTSCWDCGKVVHMTPVDGSAVIRAEDFFRHRVMGCFRCDGCQALNIAQGLGNPKAGADVLAWLAGRKKLEWLPRRIPTKSFPDVPPEIAATASEAYACRWMANGRRAAVLMARSVIEATAKDLGITDGKLIAKIDAMLAQGFIRPHVRDGAHEVRYLGNEMAHGDFVRPVSPEDADLVLTLMSEVLGDVYQSPARVARAQAAREERKRQAEQLAALLQQKPFASSPAMAKVVESLAIGQAPPVQLPGSSKQHQPGEAESRDR
jgi:hypothetical protein